MHQFVTPADNDLAINNTSRCVKRELSLRMRITPNYLARRQVNPQYIIVKGAVVGKAVNDGWRSARVSARCYLKNFLAVADANATEDFVAASNVGNASSH